MAFVIVDDTEVQVVLANITASLQPLSLGSFLAGGGAEILRQSTAERFASEGGGDWEPLKRSTERFRAMKGFPPKHPINERTGQLRRFLVNNRGTLGSAEGDVTLTFPDETANTLVDRKIRVAQTGDKDTNTPARPVLDLDGEDLRLMLSGISGWIEQVSGGLSFT